MCQVTERQDVVSGIWKFSSKVSKEVLIELAKKWKAAEPDRYLDLYVRSTGDDEEFGIGFRYVFEGPTRQKFFYRMTDQLKRAFGNDLVGWDMGSPTTIIQ